MERKNYRIIALDMDGTLLTSDKTIAPDTVRDIRAASERGIHVVYCTGRAVPELKLYFDMVPMMRYAVCSTGALVYDRVEKRCIDRRPVRSELAAALAETAKRYRAMPHILTDDETIVAADDVTHMKDFHAGIYQPMFERITRKVADMAEEARHLTSIGKVNIYFRSSEDCHACYEELRTLPLSFAMPEETTLEMTAQGVTKGSGLKALADYLHIPMAQTVGIGDSDNDRAMLHDAGLSIAMGNAQADIKAQCDLITEDNDHNGVGEAIRLIFNNLQLNINVGGKDFLLDGAKGVASIPLHTTFAGSLVIVVIFLTATALLMNSKHGRSMLAVREDDLAAQMSGINTFRSKMLAMCMSALYAGIAGGMMAHYFGYLQPKMFLMTKSTEYTIMVIFGGMGSITGSVLGTVLLCALPELLRAVGDWRLVMYGLAVIVIMIVRPKGLMGGKELPVGRICRAVGRVFTKKKKDLPPPDGGSVGEEASV